MMLVAMKATGKPEPEANDWYLFGRIGEQLGEKEAAAACLKLDHLWVVYPGEACFPMDQGISALPLSGIPDAAAGG